MSRCFLAALLHSCSCPRRICQTSPVSHVRRQTQWSSTIPVCFLCPIIFVRHQTHNKLTGLVADQSSTSTAAQNRTAHDRLWKSLPTPARWEFRGSPVRLEVQSVSGRSSCLPVRTVSGGCFSWSACLEWTGMGRRVFYHSLRWCRFRTRNWTRTHRVRSALRIIATAWGALSHGSVDLTASGSKGEEIGRDCSLFFQQAILWRAYRYWWGERIASPYTTSSLRCGELLHNQRCFWRHFLRQYVPSSCHSFTDIRSLGTKSSATRTCHSSQQRKLTLCSCW